MAKSVHNDVLDGAFNVLNDGDIMTACSAEPTTRTEAVTTYKLADVAMTPGTDYTISDGDTSGRKCRMAAKSAVPNQAAIITDYALTGGRGHFTVTALTSAPADNVTFAIL